MNRRLADLRVWHAVGLIGLWWAIAIVYETKLWWFLYGLHPCVTLGIQE